MKLLVANRSEIACRIFQACREMGISTVAITTAEDHEARHVTYADEVYRIKSYLDSNEVVGVAKKAKVDLIHPGYGFLSERPVFARAVEDAGIKFIGPRAETMELLGEKIAAKELAGKLGVPTLPWAKVSAGGDLASAAKQVGFPLLLKASAGGGGKGMRKVTKVEELNEAAESASAEAKAAFGDGTLFLERLVENPRHIEVQAFGDGLGGGIHLYERECSLQRRHQKVWEEARAPHLSENARKGLFEAALKLVGHVKYRSAGTLEFLVDENENFFFLEMNTRLQVEHPVTESVTGIDLVRTQILQALEPTRAVLTTTPEARGHAIEVRIYAEDPSQGFIPTPGKVNFLKWPTGPGIRVDSGIEVDQTVTTLYDSMLAKIIVWGVDRGHAVARMQYALEETVVSGCGTNQAYLLALSKHPQVIDGRVTTAFLEKTFAPIYQPAPSSDELNWLSKIRESFSVNDSNGSHSSESHGPSFASPGVKDASMRGHS